MGFLYRKGKYSSQKIILCCAFAIGGVFVESRGFAQESKELSVARSALRDGINSVAIKNAEEATKNGSQEIDARHVLLEALAKENRYAEIIEKTKEWNDQSDEHSRYWQAWAYFNLNDLENALSLLDYVFSNGELRLLANRLKARVYNSQGNISAASDTYQSVQDAVVSNDTLFAEVVYERAKMLDKANLKAEAFKILDNEKVLKLTGGISNALLAYTADLAEETGDSKKANDIRTRIFAKGDAVEEEIFVSVACAISKSLWLADNQEGSVKVAEKAVARATTKKMRMIAGYNLAYRELAMPSLYSNGVARIRALVRENLNEDESCKAQIALADSLLKTGNAADADKEYKFAVEAFPQLVLDEHAVEGRAWAMFRLGKYAEAVAMFARAAQISTNENTKARCYFKEGDSLVAEGLYENAAGRYARIKSGPFADSARFNCADALSRAGKNDEAYKMFSELSIDKGVSPRVRINAALRTAQSDAASGRFETAIETFTKILSPEYSGTNLTSSVRIQVLDGRGRAYYRSYRYKEAAQDFETIASDCPAEEKEMRFFVALCRYGEGKGEEARSLALELLKYEIASSLKADIILWIAKFDFTQGNYKSARKGFEEFVEKYPSSLRAAEALVFAARSAAAENNFTDVVEIVKQIANKFPNSPFIAEACVLQGEALMELARFNDAVLALERAERSTGSASLRNRAVMLKADCLFAMGSDNSNRYSEALEEYRNLLKGERLSSSVRLAVSFKVGRTLEKLQRFEEAVNQYYSEVVLAYLDARKRNEWFDENARAFFARAAFYLADSYETSGQLTEATNILQLVIKSGVSAADEAKRRYEKLRKKMKGGF